MSSKGGVLVSAGLGALAAVAGVYIAKKVKSYVATKPRRMRLFHNNLLMSTRCAWLIAELDAEKDIDFRVTDMDSDPRYCSSDCLIVELESLQDNQMYSFYPSSVRQEQDYQVVLCSPYVSYEDLRAAGGGHCGEPWWENSCQFSECRHADKAMTPQLDSPTSSTVSRSCTPPPSPQITVNDEFTMIEGAAICMYLADLYGQFLPDVQHRAEYYSWIVYSAATFDNIVKTLHHQIVELPEAQRNKAALNSALQGFNAFARALSETLSRSRYLCGNTFTAADCVLGFTLWWAYTIEEGKLLGDYPALRDYLLLLQSRPAFERTFGREERWDWGRYFKTCAAQLQY